MVFAQLCLNQHETVINFLDAVDVRGQNGLHIVLTAWLLNHADFQGLYHQKMRHVSHLVTSVLTMLIDPLYFFELLSINNCSHLITCSSAVALTKVFTSGDPRVAEIQVKGDMILTENSRRTTRSIARKGTYSVSRLLVCHYHPIIEGVVPDISLLYIHYELAPNQFTVVSAPVKIVKLLCADLITRIEEENHSGEFDDDESEEDEDEDEEASETENRKDWEGSKSHERSVLLSDVLGDDGNEYYDGAEDGDELEIDPDVLADPVYQTNLKKFLVDFFRSQLHSPGLVQCINELNDAERQTLSGLLEN